MESLIQRPSYVEWLSRWRDKDIIKVITGVRRCGKSTVMKLFSDQLTAVGVAPERIQSVNLEDPSNDAYLFDPMALYNDICARLVPDTMNYIFLDEIQRVPEFQRVAAGLNLKETIDLYLTGSSSHLLSGQLATLLTGRYVEKTMLPLSFSEYVTTRVSEQEPRLVNGRPLAAQALYGDYVTYGGFPATVRFGDDEELINDYLSGILNTVLFSDVAQNQRVTNVSSLERTARFLASSVGSPTSLRRISDTLTSAGHKVGRDAIGSYVEGMVNAYVFYPVRPTGLAGTRVLQQPDKYYMVDMGMRRTLLGNRRSDDGHVLENVVFLELLRRGHRVSSGRVGSQEVDFVVEKDGETTYIQVAATVSDPRVLERELAPLRDIPDFHPRLLLTLDTIVPSSHDGIRQVNVLDWLLES